MTNLEIIKYLATNNPTRLAGLLDDLYCDAYSDGPTMIGVQGLTLKNGYSKTLQ